jgi:hypothetical protein
MWRGIMLVMNFYVLRILFLEVIKPDISWYIEILLWIAMGSFIAIAMDDFLLLKGLCKPIKSHKRSGSEAD